MVADPIDRQKPLMIMSEFSEIDPSESPELREELKSAIVIVIGKQMAHMGILHHYDNGQLEVLENFEVPSPAFRKAFARMTLASGEATVENGLIHLCNILSDDQMSDKGISLLIKAAEAAPNMCEIAKSELKERTHWWHDAVGEILH
jgi:hypothetical protein